MISLRRAPWQAVVGDRWTDVLDAGEAVGALGIKAKNVFLAVGRQEIAHFASAPQHHYLIRSVDPVEPPLAVPNARYIIARGPFEEDQERALLLAHAIDVIVAKNSGGRATYGKIVAARQLGIPVLLLRRPPELEVPAVATVSAAIAWLDHVLKVPTDRGGVDQRGSVRSFHEARLGRSDDDARRHICIGSISRLQYREAYALIDATYGASKYNGRAGGKLRPQYFKRTIELPRSRA